MAGLSTKSKVENITPPFKTLFTFRFNAVSLKPPSILLKEGSFGTYLPKGRFGIWDLGFASLEFASLEFAL
jgi:hypothetical protein